MRRLVWWSAIATIAVIAGCSDDEPTGLDDRSAIAVCLSDVPEQIGGGVVSDLCTVSIDTGERSVVRPGVTGGTGAALSPERDAVAFFADGNLRILPLAEPSGPGGETAERVVGPFGIGPRWMSAQRVGFVTEDATRVLTVDTGEPAEPDVLFEITPEVRAVHGDIGEIGSFDWHESTGRLAVELWRDERTPGESASIVLVRSAEGDIVLAHAPTESLSAPRFHPDGTRLLVQITTEGAAGGPLGVAVVDIASGERRSIDPESAIAPSWSPDGSEVVWLSTPGQSASSTSVIAAEIEGGVVVAIRTVLTGDTGRLDRFPASLNWS